MIDTSNLVPAGTQDQPIWVSGGSYVIGQQAVSPATLKTYKRKTNGGGATDPSLDFTNWCFNDINSTKSIINAYSVTGWVAQPQSIVFATSGIKIALSGALTANTLATVLEKTGGACEITQLQIETTDATSRTIRVKVTVDGVTAFDYTSAAITPSQYGCCLAGYQNYTYSVPLGSIKASSSLKIEIASSNTETDKIRIGYAMQELN